MKHEKNTPLVSNFTRNGEIVQEEKLMKSTEAAKYLNVTRKTLAKWYENGNLTPVKVADNGYKYYSQKQLDIFRQEHPNLYPDVQNCNLESQNCNLESQNCNLESQNCKVGVKSTSKSQQKTDNLEKIDNPGTPKSVALVKNDNLNLEKSDNSSQNVDFLGTENDVIVEHENGVIEHFKMINSETRHDPNDKIAKVFFNPTDEQYAEGKIFIKEGVKNHAAVVTKITFDHINEIMDYRPRFDAFDREVCFACIAEQLAGNQITTIDSIYRTMTGSNDKKTTPKMSAKIKTSLNKMIFSKVTFDASDTCKKFGYNSKEPMMYTGSLLPAEYLENVNINGKKATCIRFLRRSPMFDFAEIKNGQIISYDKKLLDVPINNSETIITIKNYIFRRLREINDHHLTPTITFDDIFQKNGLTQLSKLQKHRFREYIAISCKHWKKYKVFTDFSIIKNRNIPYSIKFYF